MLNLLVVDDESHICDMLVFSLGDEYHVDTANNADEVWEKLADRRPDLILLDWMLPNVSGIDILNRLKKEESFNDIPVIMLTAKGEEQDKIMGLDAGADDYLPKPFSIGELKARIRSLLRRSTGVENALIEHKSLVINTATHSVSYNQSDIKLGPTEFKLLCFFASRPHRVFSRTQLLDRVWGNNVYIEERTVDVHVLRLRKALKKASAEYLITTVRGIGYRFGES